MAVRPRVVSGACGSLLMHTRPFAAAVFAGVGEPDGRALLRALPDLPVAVFPWDPAGMVLAEPLFGRLEVVKMIEGVNRQLAL